MHSKKKKNSERFISLIPGPLASVLITFSLAVLGVLLALLAVVKPDAFVNYIDPDLVVFISTAVSFISLFIILLSAVAFIYNSFDSIEEGNKNLMMDISEIGSDISRLSDNVVSLGDIREVKNYKEEIENDVSKSKKVTNTFVGIDDNDLDRPEDLYNNFLRGSLDRHWVEIIGISDCSNERYKKIDENERLQIHLLRHTPPIINFILIEGYEAEGNGSLVYFGWLGSDHPGKRQIARKNTTVYRSEDRSLINFFTEYSEVLLETYGWADRRGPHLRVGSKGLTSCEDRSADQFIIKDGWWISDLRYSKGGKIERRAILKFDFKYKDRKRISDIHVFITDENGDFNTYAAHGEAVAHRKNDIHFEWRHEIDGVETNGHCMYRFVYIDGEPKIRGFVVTEVGAVTKTEKLKGILGGYRLPVNQERDIEQWFRALKYVGGGKKSIGEAEKKYIEDKTREIAST